MRLDKYLADMGVGTRKEIREIVKCGRVTVNGDIIKIPDSKIDENADVIMLDGNLLKLVKNRYFLMNKPAGVLCATEDKKQKTVIDLLPPELRRIGLFPVGRLDKDTRGMLLLTNDGEFAHKVISPKSDISKRYYAKTEGIPDERDSEAFRKGIVLKDGLECLPAVLETTGRNECFVTVKEGKYHQVKRMLASVGKPVVELTRLSIGSLGLEKVPDEGSFVELSQSDLKLIIR